MKTYSGCREADVCQIWIVDEKTTHATRQQLRPDRSLKIANHSPAGFEWGYCGSGPAQTALAILLDHFSEPRDFRMAVSLYQDFKRQVVSQMPKEWQLTDAEIELWISGTEAKSVAYFKAKWDGARSEGLEPV